MSSPSDSPHLGDLHDDPPPLPRVEPPTAGFLLQLFFIPLLIVAIIVSLWLAFSWFAQAGSDPTQLVGELERGGPQAWSRALTLADVLRDPHYASLKHDPEFADRLAKVLDRQITAGELDEGSIRMRFYLARALGEFFVPQPLPTLVRAAREERERKEADVRIAALEALAVLANNCGPAVVLADPDLPAALDAALVERGSDDADREIRDRLHERAAFLLGVLGGEQQLDRLAGLQGDRAPTVRFNATLGLARHGDERATPGLEAMLDPHNDEVTAGEKSPEAVELKRLVVWQNALEGVRQLTRKNPQADLAPLRAAVERLLAALPAGPVHALATEVLQSLPR